MQRKIIHTYLPWFTMLQKEEADLGGRGLILNYIYGFTSQKPNVEDKLIKHFNCFNLLGTQTDSKDLILTGFVQHIWVQANSLTNS